MQADRDTGCTCFDETTRKCPVPGHPYQVGVSPVDGGCWFCFTTDPCGMVFDTEFDTNVHIRCIERVLRTEPEHAAAKPNLRFEAELMAYLLEGAPPRELDEL